MCITRRHSPSLDKKFAWIVRCLESLPLTQVFIPIIGDSPLKAGLDSLDHGTAGWVAIFLEQVSLRTAKNLLFLAILYLVDDHSYPGDLPRRDGGGSPCSLLDKARCRVAFLLAPISVGTILDNIGRHDFNTYYDALTPGKPQYGSWVGHFRTRELYTQVHCT